MLKVEVQKNKAALEDLLFGVGTETQTRGNQEVQVTKINAANLPFDETQSLKQFTDEVMSQYATLMENRDLLLGALEVVTLLNALSVNIDDLSAWLVNGGVLSPFIPMVQTVTGTHYLADNLNYITLEDTVFDEEAVINLGINTELYILKGEEFTP